MDGQTDRPSNRGARMHLRNQWWWQLQWRQWFWKPIPSSPPSYGDSKYRQTGERMVTLDLRKHIYCIFPRGIQIWGQKWQNPPGSLRVVALNEHFWWFLVFFFFSATIAINRLQDTNSHAIWWQPMSRNVFWLIWTIKCPVGRFQGPLLSIFQFFRPFDGSLDTTTNCSFFVPFFGSMDSNTS